MLGLGSSSRCASVEMPTKEIRFFIQSAKIALRVKIQSKLKAAVHGESTLKQAEPSRPGRVSSRPVPSIDAVARTSDDVDLPLSILTQFPPRDQPPIKFGLPLQRRPISAAAGRHAGDEEHRENGSTSVRPRRLYIGLGRPAGRRTEPRPHCSGTAVGLDAERCAEALPSHSLTVRRCGVRERR